MAIRSENIYDIYRLISREIDTAFGEATARTDLLQRVASINAIPQPAGPSRGAHQFESSPAAALPWWNPV